MDSLDKVIKQIGTGVSPRRKHKYPSARNLKKRRKGGRWMDFEGDARMPYIKGYD